MTTPAHRAATALSPLQLILRLILALAVALLSVPLLGSSAYAEGGTDATASSSETAPAEEPLPAEPPAEQPPAGQPPTEEAPPAAEPSPEEVVEEEPEAEPAPAPAEQEVVTSQVKKTVDTVVKAAEESVEDSRLEEAVETRSLAALVTDSCQQDSQPTVDLFEQFTRFDINDPSGEWINGNVNHVKGNLREGAFVWQRLTLADVPEGANSVTIEYRYNYDDNNGDGVPQYAYDFLANWSIDGASPTSVGSPVDIDDAQGITQRVTIEWTQTGDDTAVIIFGAHIASELDWGPGNGASEIEGSPYHVYLHEANCEGLSSRDNQIMVSAIPAGFITIVKDAVPNSGDDFAFNISRSDNDDDFWLDDDGDGAAPGTAGDQADPNPNSTTYFLSADTYTIDELSANTGGWALTDIVCDDTDALTNLANGTATVTLADDQEILCEFTNKRTASITVDKQWVINGVTVSHADAIDPEGAYDHLGLSAQLTIDGANKDWGTHGGYLQGAPLTLDEVTAATNDLCGPITESIDTGDASLPETVTLGAGSNAYTITNTVDCDGELVLKKVVQDSFNGGAQPSDFELYADPGTPAVLADDLVAQGAGVGSGVGFTVDPATTFTLSEGGFEAGDARGAMPAGYTLQSLVCDGQNVTADPTVQVELGRTMTCVFTNVDSPSSLTLDKVWADGGTGVDIPETNWILSATPNPAIAGQDTISGADTVTGTSVKAGRYILSESLADDAIVDANDYTAGEWACVLSGTTTDVDVVAVDIMGTLVDTVTLAPGQHVTCTIINTGVAGDYSVEKSADPVSGTTVEPGDTITYTITVTHSGSGLPVNGVTIEDDLSQVLDHSALTDGPDASTGTASVVGDELTWSIPSVTGVHTVTYEVTVDEGAWGVTLSNLVTSDKCPTVAECTTSHPTPHYDLWKTNVPGDGESVQPEDTVTYTLHLRNDSDGVLAAGEQITDNLVDVLDDATLVQPLAAGLSLSGTTLTWTLAADVLPGDEVSISYAVVVDEDAWGTILRNVVVPGDGGDCPTPGQEPDCSTSNPTPSYDLWKTNVPGDGVTVQPGEPVTYTLHLLNTSDAVLSGETIEDDLSDVLDNATLDEEGLDASLSLSGTTLTWTVPDVPAGLSATVSYTVTVDAGAWGEELVNLVTPGPGGECVPPGCTTDNPTPHWTLTKTSDPADGSTVMPGDEITYTLHVVNDSLGVVAAGATVTDDLSDVLDNATLEADLDDALSLTGSTLTWTLPELAPGDTAEVSYTVTVNASQWDVDLVNVATPDLSTGGECPAFAEGADDPCSTSHDTPPVTTLVVQKVDLETSEPLEGATFVLYDDNEPFADPTNPVIGDEDVALGSRVSDAEGLARWAELLQGNYLVEETAAPEDYLLPEQPVMAITIDDSNFVAGGEMAPILFRDLAEGLLSVVAKRQFELVGEEWVESDGIIEYGELVKYVVSIEAIGPKLFHNVQVTDYVPGFNPEDTTSTAQGELVPGSAICTGELELLCDVTVSEDNLVTWEIGNDEPITDIAGDVEMVVQFPEAPAEPEFDENGEFRTVLWNVGFLEYDEVVGGTPDAPAAALTSGAAAARGMASSLAMALDFQHTRLRSNEVVIEAVIIQPTGPVLPPEPPEPPTPPEPGVVPTPPALPDTGASAWLVQLAALGALAIALGLGLTVAGRRKEEAEAEAPGA